MGLPQMLSQTAHKEKDALAEDAQLGGVLVEIHGLGWHVEGGTLLPEVNLVEQAEQLAVEVVRKGPRPLVTHEQAALRMREDTASGEEMQTRGMGQSCERAKTNAWAAIS